MSSLQRPVMHLDVKFAFLKGWMLPWEEAKCINI
jgi:hypothetical protein